MQCGDWQSLVRMFVAAGLRAEWEKKPLLLTPLFHLFPWSYVYPCLCCCSFRMSLSIATAHGSAFGFHWHFCPCAAQSLLLLLWLHNHPTCLCCFTRSYTLSFKSVALCWPRTASHMHVHKSVKKHDAFFCIVRWMLHAMTSAKWLKIQMP